MIDYAYRDMGWDILEVGVGKENDWKKIYYESTPDRLATQASSRKEQMKRIKGLQSRGIDPSIYFPDEEEEDDDDDEDDEYYRRA